MDSQEIEFEEYVGVFSRYVRRLDSWLKQQDPERFCLPQPEPSWFSGIGYLETNNEVVVFEHPFYPSSVLCSQLVLYFDQGMMIIIVPHEYMVPVRLRVLIYGSIDKTIQDRTVGEFLCHACPHIMPQH